MQARPQRKCNNVTFSSINAILPHFGAMHARIVIFSHSLCNTLAELMKRAAPEPTGSPWQRHLCRKCRGCPACARRTPLGPCSGKPLLMLSASAGMHVHLHSWLRATRADAEAAQDNHSFCAVATQGGTAHKVDWLMQHRLRTAPCNHNLTSVITCLCEDASCGPTGPPSSPGMVPHRPRHSYK